MKRELSPQTIIAAEDNDGSERTGEMLTPTKKPKCPASASPGTPRKKQAEGIKGDWTPEKRAELVEMIWTTGAQTLGLQNMADRLGMSKKQIDNAVCKGQQSNLRAKMIKLAGEIGK